MKIRLVPFVITLLILEEVIPLIVLYAPGMLPSTCVLPSQRERIESKRKQKQRDVYELFREKAAALETAQDSSVKSLDGMMLKALCRFIFIIIAYKLSRWR